MTDRRLLRHAEVADLLGRPAEWLYKNKRRLIEQEGFPPPVSAIGNCWDSAAIDAWLDNQMQPELRAVATRTESENEDWARRLTERIDSGEAFGR